MEVVAITIVGGTAVYYSAARFISWMRAEKPLEEIVLINRAHAPTSAHARKPSPEREDVASAISSFRREGLRKIGIDYAEGMREKKKGAPTGIYAELERKLLTIAKASEKSPNTSPEASPRRGSLAF